MRRHNGPWLTPPARSGRPGLGARPGRLLVALLLVPVLLVSACGAKSDDAVAGGPASQIVADAIENTLSVSWVAETTLTVDGQESTQATVYHPADPAKGAEHPSLLTTSEAPGSDRRTVHLLPPDGSELLFNCESSMPPPCGPDRWIRSTAITASAEGAGADGRGPGDLTDQYTHLGVVDPDTATAVDGHGNQFEVTANLAQVAITSGQDEVPEIGPCCKALLVIEDAQVVRLVIEIDGASEGTWTTDFSSFGDATDIEVPAEEDIVDIADVVGSGPGPQCAVFVEVEPGADVSTIERVTKEFVSRTGRLDAELDRELSSIAGYVSLTNTDISGCDPADIHVGVTSVNYDVSGPRIPSTTVLADFGD